MNPLDQASRAASVFLPRSEFDAFLFARVDEETNGMTLNVLSMLARAGVDPWRQAAELTLMPNGIAVEKLASLIGELPAGVDEHRDAGTIARRLISLLPRRTGSMAPQNRVRGYQEIRVQAVAIVVVLIALLVGVGWMSANREAPAHSADTAPMSGSATLAQPELPENARR
jgi:hypothetical protein